MEFLQVFFTENDCYKRNREQADSRYTTFQTRGPLGIMLHSTGVNNPLLSRYVGPDEGTLGENPYGNHWNRPGLEVCVHAFVGRDKAGTVRACQTLPWNFRGWHCGGTGNDTHVGIELCEDNLEDKAYFSACYDAAVELSAHICRENGLNPLEDGVILDHREGYLRGMASGHGDVGHWFSRFGKTMDGFRRDVSARLTAPPASQNRIYRTLEELPDWARPVIEPLVESGAIEGEGDGLNLSYDLVRTLVILARVLGWPGT